jgi:hypothetical protein
VVLLKVTVFSCVPSPELEIRTRLPKLRVQPWPTSVLYRGDKSAEIGHGAAGILMVPPAGLGHEVERVAADLKHCEITLQTETIARKPP